jgi:hypothetical protein
MSPACEARLWTTRLRSLRYILADLAISVRLTRRTTAWCCVIGASPAITLPSQVDQEATTGPRCWRRLPRRGPVAPGPP